LDDHNAIVESLGRMLFDAMYRSEFIEGGLVDGIPIAESPLGPYLARVDVRELTQVGSRIRSAVLTGGDGSGLGLRGHFKRTLPAAMAATGWTERELVERYIASPHFASFRDVPYSALGRGVTLPESFYRYVTAALSENLEPLVYDEAVTGAFKSMAAGGRATFDVGFGGLCSIGAYHALYRVNDAAAMDSWVLPATRMYLLGHRSFIFGAVSEEGFAQLTEALRLIAAGTPEQCSTAILERLRRWGML